MPLTIIGNPISWRLQSPACEITPARSADRAAPARSPSLAAPSALCRPSCSNPSLPPASAYVRQGIFTGIRFSTRPDCLGDEVVELISKYPVRAVELGVQSLSDTVLQKSRRGYSARSVEESAKRVRDSGWALGIQMMAGLPGDTRGLFIQSMDKAIALAPDFLRIYPTLVLAGTNLADSFRKGIYTPLSLDEAVTWLTPAYAAALRAGIPVIRMGLHPDPALEKPGVILAGPYHPAFGHLVRCPELVEGPGRSGICRLLRTCRGRNCAAGLPKPGERCYWTWKVKPPALESPMEYWRKGDGRDWPGRD